MDVHSLWFLHNQFRGEGPNYLRDLLPKLVGKGTDYKYLGLLPTDDADIHVARFDIFKQ